VAERPVKFVVDVEGNDEAQRQFENTEIKLQEATETTQRLTAELRKLQSAEGSSADAIDAMRRQVIRATQAQEKMRAEAGGTTLETIALRQKLGQLGSTVGQVGAVLGRVNPEWSEMGAVIGGIGAQIPALTGSLGPVAQGIAAITVAVDLGTQAWEMWTGATDAAATAAEAAKGQVTDLANSLTALHTRQAEIAGAGAITDLEAVFNEADQRVVSMQEVLDTQRAAAEQRRIDAAREIGVLRRSMQEAVERSPSNAGLIRTAGREAREIDRLTRGVQRANDNVRNLAESLRRQRTLTDEAEEALGRARDRPVGFGDVPEPTRRGGGGESAQARRAREAMEFNVHLKELEAEEIARIEAAQLALARTRADEEMRFAQAAKEQRQIFREEELAAEQETARQRAEIRREEVEQTAQNVERMQEIRAESIADLKADAEAAIGRHRAHDPGLHRRAVQRHRAVAERRRGVPGAARLLPRDDQPDGGARSG
jgi:hypothetical protein